MGLASGRFLTTLLQEGTTAGGSGGFNVGELVHLIILSVIFVAIGLVVFGLAFLLITKLTPFSIRKEIEEDQNTALGIVIGSVIIGLSIIIAAAIG